MERSDALIKLVSVLVFLTVMVYMGVSFISSYSDPLRTVYATSMEKHDGLETQGYIVRDEQVITASGENIAVTATEGAKVALGETLAVRYVGSTAMERAQRISEIQMTIRQLTALKNGENGDSLADAAVLSLAGAVAGGDLSRLYSVEQDIDAYIITGNALATGDEDQRIAELEEELRRLSQDSSSDTVHISAPISGTFSANVDGFESVSPSNLEELTPGEYDSLFAAPAEPSSDAIGRLARGIKWYYVTKVDEKSAMKLTAGRTVKLIFSRTYSAELNMRIEHVSQPENGQCAVVFSCDRYLQNTAALREATAQIVFGTTSGISVPKEAVHLDEDGTPIVYILEGVTAHKTVITIIAESGDYYIAESTKDGLRVDDLIIVRARSLYNGAVVEG